MTDIRVGQNVRYVAEAGDSYTAVVTEIHSPEIVDLDVPAGGGSIVHLSRVLLAWSGQRRGRWRPLEHGER